MLDHGCQCSFILVIHTLWPLRSFIHSIVWWPAEKALTLWASYLSTSRFWVVGVSIYFLPIRPYIQISISGMRVSIAPSRAVWLLMIFWWLSSVTSAWQGRQAGYSSCSEDPGFTYCSSWGVRDILIYVLYLHFLASPPNAGSFRMVSCPSRVLPTYDVFRVHNSIPTFCVYST